MESRRHAVLGLLTNVDAAVVVLERSRRQRRLARQELRALPAGADVVLCDQRLASRWRVRRFAARAGIDLDREYVSVPSARCPQVLVQDRPGPVSYFWDEIATVPTACGRSHAVLTAARRVGAACPFRGRVGGWLLGRVSVGRRS